MIDHLTRSLPMSRHRSNTMAEDALAEIMEDAIREYECPTDRRGEPIMEPDHFAAHLGRYLAERGEQAEESGECCPLCDVVRERFEVAA